MERINMLLDKIRELNGKKDLSLIDIDLMTDYVKVVYADLLEWRNKISFNNAVTIKPEVTALNISDAPEINNIATSGEANKVVELEQNLSDIGHLQQEQNTISFPSTLSDYADIRKRIGINDKYQFISELFGNNKEAYEEVIGEINTFDTEEEAIAWLNNISNQFNWQDDSETVQTFYMLLSDHFGAR